MNIVYFNEELNARAPTVMGVLCDASTNSWTNLFDVVELIKAGETVTIRPASEQELQRAEGRVALYDIGVALGAQISALLDHEPPEETDKKLEGLRDVLASYDMGFPGLVDVATAPGVEESAAEPQADEPPVDAIPVFCAGLNDAYAAGDIATALVVADHVASTLRDLIAAQPANEQGTTQQQLTNAQNLFNEQAAAPYKSLDMLGNSIRGAVGDGPCHEGAAQ